MEYVLLGMSRSYHGQFYDDTLSSAMHFNHMCYKIIV